MQEDIQGKIELLKAMDCIIINLDDDLAYKKWWNGIYAVGYDMRKKEWCEIAGSDNDFSTLCAMFREIMSKHEITKFVLEN